MRLLSLILLAAAGALLSGGLAGVYRYLDSNVLHRGVGPPDALVPAAQQGTLTSFVLRSPAIGGRPERVLVYIPAGYSTSGQRYPAVYLLHGTPGDPRSAYINSLHVPARLDALIAAHTIRPMVVVMPPGSPSTYNKASEWANSPAPQSSWFDYLARDVVHAVDTRYRVIAARSGRGIGGFSSGADAALNALILRPDEVSVAEGWSGDYRQSPASVAHDAATVARFSATLTAPGAAATLGKLGSYAYIYSGRKDKVLPATLAVSEALRLGGVNVKLEVTDGGHAWILWSQRLDGALRYFSEHLR